jgi:hypothetical protein
MFDGPIVELAARAGVTVDDDEEEAARIAAVPAAQLECTERVSCHPV